MNDINIDKIKEKIESAFYNLSVAHELLRQYDRDNNTNWELDGDIKELFQYIDAAEDSWRLVRREIR